MSEIKHCAECGAPLPAYWPKGLCAQCALEGALDMSHAESQVLQQEPLAAPAGLKPPGASTEGSPLGSFGDYELLEEIARGGMGVVYKARQRNLNRIVAVKTILAGPLAGKEFVRRFRTESAAAAILQHPNIVAIHDVGLHEGRHYFSMDYVEGRSLAQLVGQRPLAPARAARHVELIAAAIHYAHERGILHRDLKPSNVLIDAATDQPRITDFGLARRLDGDSSLTLTGQVLGSPNFMPPEQAGRGRGKVGRPSDVYALGGILYYLLTARAPFQADSLEHLIEQVLHAEPVAPRLLNPSVPRDLETITLKCLEKEPSRRYQTAKELADELGRVLRHEPIQARPVTAPEKVWRWCRRKPALASAVVFALVALVIGLATTFWQWRRAEHRLYVAKINLMQAAWEQNNVSRVRQLLAETAPSRERAFEWFYWQRQTHLEQMNLRGHLGPVLAVAVSPDGRRIATAGADNTAIVWDAADGKRLFPLEGHSEVISSVAFSPDSQRLVTGSWDTTAKLWNAAGGKESLTLTGHTDKILSVAVSPDGRWIATASADNTAIVWNAADGKRLFPLNGHSQAVFSVTFSTDGQRLATGGWDGAVKIWSAADGTPLLTNASNARILSVAFSPDDRRVVAGAFDGTAWMWDATTGDPRPPLIGHSGPVNSVVFSRDGLRIATGSRDQTAKVWDAANGRELLTVKGHSTAISSVAFTPDGQQIVTGGGLVAINPGGFAFLVGGGPETAKVWNATESKGPVSLSGHDDTVLSVVYSQDGQRIVTGSWDTTAKLWDAPNGREWLTLEGHTGPVQGVDLSRDGRQVVTGSLDGTAKVWDAATGSTLATLEGHSGPVHSVAFSPDGRRIITGSETAAIVWEAASGRKLFSLEGHNILTVAYSPDGRRLFTGSGDGTGRVWEAHGGKELLRLEGGPIRAADFSPDSRRLVTGSLDQTASVWDALNGRRLAELKGHGGTILGVAFSPDGQRIVTGSGDRTAKVWEASTGLELLTLKGHDGTVFSAVFSPDGRRIVTGGEEGAVKIWEADSVEQVENRRAGN